MSFSYDTSLSTAKDRLRFYTTDTVEASAVFSDEELNGIVAQYPDELFAAAMCLRNRAAYFAARAISFSIGAGNNDSIRVDRRTLPKFYMDLADKLENRSLTTPDEFIDSFAFQVNEYGQDRSEYIGENIDLIDLIDE